MPLKRIGLLGKAVTGTLLDSFTNEIYMVVVTIYGLSNRSVSLFKTVHHYHSKGMS